MSYSSKESLTLRPSSSLPISHLVSFAQFTQEFSPSPASYCSTPHRKSAQSSSQSRICNFSKFPRGLVEIAEITGVKSFMYRSRNGEWNSAEYGEHPLGEALGGTSFDAVLSDCDSNNTAVCQDRWESLLRGISSMTNSPLPPTTSVTKTHNPTSVPCTQNLSRLLSLLPCRKTGFLSSFEPTSLFRGRYVELTMEFSVSEEKKHTLTIGINSVLNGGVESVMNATNVCGSKNNLPRYGISLSDVFGSSDAVLRPCSVADSSQILTVVPDWTLYEFDADKNEDKDDLSSSISIGDNCIEKAHFPLFSQQPKSLPLSPLWPSSGRDPYLGFVTAHNLPAQRGLSMSTPWVTFPSTSPPRRSPAIFAVDRVLRQPGSNSGGSADLIIRNGHRGHSVSLSVEEKYPNFVEIDLGSVAVIEFLGGGAGDENFVPVGVDSGRSIPIQSLMDFDITVLVDGSISLTFTRRLPPDSSIIISAEFEPKFLRIEDFTADVNRGIEWDAGIVTFEQGDEARGRKIWRGGGDILNNIITPPASVTLMSNTALFHAPPPDMSMPFNVITLSCTLVAFLVGTSLNIFVRKQSKAKGLISKLKRLWRKKSRRRGKN